MIVANTTVLVSTVEEPEDFGKPPYSLVVDAEVLHSFLLASKRTAEPENDELPFMVLNTAYPKQIQMPNEHFKMLMTWCLCKQRSRHQLRTQTNKQADVDSCLQVLCSPGAVFFFVKSTLPLHDSSNKRQENTQTHTEPRH